MLRVRECAGSPGPGAASSRAELSPHKPPARRLRLAALTALGLALGASATIFTVSMVQAEDDAGIRAFHRDEAARTGGYRPEPERGRHVVATAYAPARARWNLPLFNAAAGERIPHPPVLLNPFRSQRANADRRRPPGQNRAAERQTVSGAADAARTICVRMCDGFHAPIGHLRARSDMKAHEALCEAMNPGVPVKVFRVPAGATTIDRAIGPDGRTYGSLPVAFGHEKSADAACRPAIVEAGERRVSLLRDITLRPGDSVVLDGKVRTFTGATRWPYSPSDFEDFRGSRELSARQRRMIDDTVGISRREAQLQALRRQLRTRQASLSDETVASDALPLRGTLAPQSRGPVRIVAQPGVDR